MRLAFYIPDNIVNNAYNELKNILTNNENILFNSMSVVHPTFTSPLNGAQYQIKFVELEKILQRKAISGGQELSFKLFEEIFNNLNTSGFGIINRDDFGNIFSFEIQPNCKIKLNDSINWYYEHSIQIVNGHHNFSQDFTLTIHSRQYRTVVPEYIIQYFHTALNSFKQRLYPVCLALISIIIEGTLKDVLLTRGYTFEYTNKRLPNYISGLGKALDNARNIENFVTAADLPIDLDLVIKPIRNNLIHLSGDAFNTRLPYLDGYEGIQNFTIGHFVKDPVLMHDLLLSASGLVEKLYMDLRQAGHLI